MNGKDDWTTTNICQLLNSDRPLRCWWQTVQDLILVKNPFYICHGEVNKRFISLAITKDSLDKDEAVFILLR